MTAKPILAVFVFTLAGCAASSARGLRVCADPNNLPFSNDRREGFENKIVDLLARDMGASVSYVWWAQRRGFARHTLKANTCDLWPGVASGMKMMATTAPYYRSSYEFVTRADRHLHIASLDDPQLRSLRIGVQMVGNDAVNTPPAHALAQRGITSNVRGYMLYGDYAQPNPPAGIVAAVAQGDIDVGIVWGPLAGYFAQRFAHALSLSPVTPALDPQTPMTFAISMGVQKGNEELRISLDRSLTKNAGAISEILDAYHIPLVEKNPR